MVLAVATLMLGRHQIHIVPIDSDIERDVLLFRAVALLFELVEQLRVNLLQGIRDGA